MRNKANPFPLVRVATKGRENPEKGNNDNNLKLTLFLCVWSMLRTLYTLCPWRRAQQPTPVFTPGESHGQRRLVSYSSLGRKESDPTEAT